MKKYPSVFVLTLNWNGKQITIDCVESVLKSDYPHFRAVVIDNGSTDGSNSALRRKFGNRITILENKENLGYAQGFNIGLNYGFEKNNADYCLVMNNDTVIDPSAISEMVRVAETDDSIGFVTGKVYYFDNPTVLQTVGIKEDPITWLGNHIGKGEEDRGQYDTMCERYFADDVFTLVRRKLYQETHGYNPLFFLESEETDWQARAKKRGYKIVYTPNAKLWHRVSVTIGKASGLQAYYDAKNPMLVVLLHKSPHFFRRYFWFHLRRDVIRGSLVSLKQGKMATALAKWQGFFACITWGMKNKKVSLRHFV
ncbi:MAG: glycosyltransferase family 2 protein [candidate division WOR-3 bacterium]|nr:MAG: glycosyltransferase family 2 protein [candidate division WOR-3 bacterium]